MRFGDREKDRKIQRMVADTKKIWNRDKDFKQRQGSRLEKRSKIEGTFADREKDLWWEFIKENKNVRKQENKNSTKKATKKTRNKIETITRPRE